MSIQKIYKSGMPLVCFSCITVSLASSFGLAPDAVAKQIGGPVEKAQPVITLSQVQPLGSPLVPAASLASVKPRTSGAVARRPSSPGRGKKKAAIADHYRLGLSLKAKGDVNKALVEFLKATQKNPRQINAFYEQALIFRQQGYLKLADSSLEQALRIAKSSTKTYGKKTSQAAKIFNENDLTRIRLLLATVRLEQGNVGSAAEELSRSLGITLTLPNKEAEGEIASDREPNSPTTILQLHPQVEEGRQKEVKKKKPQPAPIARVNEDDLWSEPGDTKTASAAATITQTTAALAEPEKETPADATVSALLREGIAGLKEHVFNPLSILGIPRISVDTEKADPGKKEKQTRRSFWSETKRRAAERAEKAAQERKLAAEKRRAEQERIAEEKLLAQEKKIAAAKALAEAKKLAAEQKLAEIKRLREEKKLAQEKRIADAEKSAEENAPDKKKKRLGWLEKHLSLTPDQDETATKRSNHEDSSEIAEDKTKSPESKEITIADRRKAQRAERSEETQDKVFAREESKEDKDDVVYTSKTAALTFTPEHTASALSNGEDSGDSVEGGSFSLTMPPAITKRISLVAALLSAFNHEERHSTAEKPPEKPVDPIDARLKYLAEHGTSSLKEGEAFMFSEESGEATLFMGNGEVIRRTIAIARGHEEVAKLRRPDILIPEELIYNLALMAKILPKQDEPKESEISVEQKETAPTLKMPEILGKPHSFTDWLRDVLNL